ncbi:MAG: glycosyltransferase family 4 protein [Gammaproteobacteria bacterium]|nr:glycosyltransferase family 4 protein [Gammaproteobacteria bacterium]
MRRPVAVVVKGWPRLSETFIAQEILALERRGLEIVIVSLRRPTDRFTHPIHADIRSPVHYLPEYLHEAPGRVLGAWKEARRLPGYTRARRMWLADLARDCTRNRVRRFGQALVLAAELGRVGSIHAHFLHTPASVARYASAMLGIGWSFSAHAKDVWTTPDWEKREKLAGARFGVTCTRANLEHLAALAPSPDVVALVYHGLDHGRFPARVTERPPRDGSDPSNPVRILSVGRLVEKKGFDDLLAALASVSPALAWTLDVVGGGALEGRLQRQASALGIGERVRWHGSLPHDRVVEHFAGADLFALASRISADGDRDGLPNVLMEAQLLGAACVATRVSGTPELIVHEDNGLLVPPRDTAALAAALERAIVDPALRSRLADAGRRTVTTRFSFEDGIAKIAARLTAPSAPAPQSNPARAHGIGEPAS